MTLLQAFHDAEGGDQYNRLAEMVVRLLRLNYDLTDDALVGACRSGRPTRPT